MLHTDTFEQITGIAVTQTGFLTLADIHAALVGRTFAWLVSTFLVHLGVPATGRPHITLETVLFRWMADGFVGGPSMAQRLRWYSFVLMGWMGFWIPTSRRSRHPSWRLLCAFALVLGWFELWSRASRCGIFRVILRILHPRLQRHSLLRRTSHLWSLYTRTLRSALDGNDTDACYSCVYVAWGRQAKSWYVG